MKKSLSIVVVVILLLALGYSGLNRVDSSAGHAPVLHGAPPSAALLVRGEYLTKAADCAACHTVKGSGQPFAGGVAFALPFGVLYSSNITADLSTGIGNWSDEQFIRAMHDGVRRDGQRLYPAFPYTSYTKLSRTDVLAIKAYLFSLPKIVRQNQALDFGFPFNQRWAMGFWNAAFFDGTRFEADRSRSEEWNTGAYLATALGHCGECHTPRNVAFAVRHGDELAGERIQGWRAPNITSDRDHGIGAWPPNDVARYLLTGHADGRGSAGGPMGEAVENSLQYLAPDDAAALVTYLRTVPARTGEDPVDINPRPESAMAATSTAPAQNLSKNHQQGLRLFASACSSCHQWNGAGQQVGAASLIGVRSVNDPGGSNVAQMILQGTHMRISGTEVFMPSFASAYTDTEVAELTNYVIAQFGDKSGTMTPAAVAKLRTIH